MKIKICKNRRSSLLIQCCVILSVLLQAFLIPRCMWAFLSGGILELLDCGPCTADSSINSWLKSLIIAVEKAQNCKVLKVSPSSAYIQLVKLLWVYIHTKIRYINLSLLLLWLLIKYHFTKIDSVSWTLLHHIPINS